MKTRNLENLKRDLEAYVSDIASGIGRSERKFWCMTYMRGLLLDGERKSIEPMAQRLSAIEQPEKDYVQALQQSVNQSNWEDEIIRESMRQRIGRTFGHAGAVSATFLMQIRMGPARAEGRPHPGRELKRWAIEAFLEVLHILQGTNRWPTKTNVLFSATSWIWRWNMAPKPWPPPLPRS